MLQALVALLPWKVIGKLAASSFLTSKKTKDQLIKDLREGAKKTDTDYDDAAVDAFEKVWDAAIPILVSKL